MIKKLLLSVVPGLLAAPVMAANININPGQNAVTAVASAHSGDTVTFGSGTFNVNSPITIPSGVTVQGVSVSATHIIFNLNGGDHTSYGFLVAGNASNVTIQQLDLVSNHGVIQLSLGNPYHDSYQNIVISHNNLQYGAGNLSDGTYVYGISVTMPNNGLQVTHNYFHDSPNAIRNWCIFYANNANLDYNQFYNINDGGQLQYPGSNVSFSYNYGTNIHRMCQESATQQGSSVDFNGNVFYNFTNPYPDTDCISIVGVSGEINFTNNFFDASTAPGSSWGSPDGSGTHRFGFAIEGTGEPLNCTGNTFVGIWAECLCSDIPKANASGNNVYGFGLWGNFSAESGPFGIGSVIASNNTSHPLSSAPTPPANTFAGPSH